MEILDLQASKEFSPTHHVYKTLAETPHSSISVVGWEPGQTSPIHSHPDADEIYHVLEGEGLFNDRSEERRVGKECRSRWTTYHCKERGSSESRVGVRQRCTRT